MLLIDCVFLLDMIFCFFTTYTNFRELKEVYKLKAIAINYLKFWFWIDFASIFPMWAFMGHSMDDHEN